MNWVFLYRWLCFMSVITFSLIGLITVLSWIWKPRRKKILSRPDDLPFFAAKTYPAGEPETFLRRLRRMSVTRSMADKPDGFGHAKDPWNLPEWGNALAGETGELCNKLKKWRRRETQNWLDVRREAADVAIYLDLLCDEIERVSGERCDLEEIITEKFNSTSQEKGLKYLL
jgi:NTP pyrophosphatase (non-canonical NTP hydrolase)